MAQIMLYKHLSSQAAAKHLQNQIIQHHKTIFFHQLDLLLSWTLTSQPSALTSRSTLPSHFSTRPSRFSTDKLPFSGYSMWVSITYFKLQILLSNMKKKINFSFFSLCKQALMGWLQDDATVWCAALAYYTIFSLGPLFLIIISVTGLIFGKASIEGELHTQVQGVLGDEGTKMFETMIAQTKKPATGLIGTTIGVMALLLGAIGVFRLLQQMFNKIWGVATKPKQGLRTFMRGYLLNFCMIAVIAFLLLVSLIASTAIATLRNLFDELISISPVILEIANFLLSFFVITLLFALIYKVLPNVEIKWKNVWMGLL